MSKVIEIRDLGLAAFAKMKGLELESRSARVFKFRTDDETITRDDLEVEYANSCCRQHDANVMYLRHLTLNPQ